MGLLDEFAAYFDARKRAFGNNVRDLPTWIAGQQQAVKESNALQDEVLQGRRAALPETRAEYGGLKGVFGWRFASLVVHRRDRMAGRAVSEGEETVVGG